MPLPPYIAAAAAATRRPRRLPDRCSRARPGAVAAPTAGAALHAGADGGAGRARHRPRVVTLHVGAGTFLPVKVDGHRRSTGMHAECGEIGRRRRRGGRAPRARPAGAWSRSAPPSLRALGDRAAGPASVPAWRGETRLFITPGYRFRVVDRLLTNFHLPRSTLFMLVAAFAGPGARCGRPTRTRSRARYRFYSYGDACLLDPGRTA